MLVAGAMSLSACAGLGTTPNAALDYQPELFSSADTHTSRFDYSPGVTCEAARRALLSQGYIISEAKPDQVRARKLFQPEVDRHVELEFRVVCAGQGADKRVTEAFANGVQDQYGMRKVKSSASLGVGGVGSVSLPVQGDNDTLVKIGSHTVTDPKMYRRFFELMHQHLDPHASLGGPLEPPVAKAAPAPKAASQPNPATQPVVVVLPMGSMLPMTAGTLQVTAPKGSAAPMAVLPPAVAASAPKGAGLPVGAQPSNQPLAVPRGVNVLPAGALPAATSSAVPATGSVALVPSASEVSPRLATPVVENPAQ